MDPDPETVKLLKAIRQRERVRIGVVAGVYRAAGSGRWVVRWPVLRRRCPKVGQPGVGALDLSAISRGEGLDVVAPGLGPHLALFRPGGRA